MTVENSNETRERDVEDTPGSMRAALIAVWLVRFAAMGVLAVVGMPDPSTSVEVPTGPRRAEDGSWVLEAVQAVRRQALEAHGADSPTSTPMGFEDGQLFEVKVDRPDRIPTAWEVAEDRRRVTVCVDVDGAVALREVTEPESAQAARSRPSALGSARGPEKRRSSLRALGEPAPVFAPSAPR